MMMERHILTFGYIPADHPGGVISCGNAENETTLIITESDILHAERGESKKIVDANFFSAHWSMWHDIANDWFTSFGGSKSKIDARLIARCWGWFLYEPIDEWEPIVVAEEHDGGEFENHQGHYNNRYYVRYQFDEDGEYFGERVIII